LRRLNDAVHRLCPGVCTIAEESTTWPMVSRPTHLGGLGFDMKWDMGWMHDTLDYLGHDPLHRKSHHDKLTFRMFYAFSENFVLPMSHDEVVHGKGSLLSRMPGDEWQRFATLRALFGYMFAQPGKKLLFMGSEFGQWREWNHERELDWHLLESPLHAGLQRWVEDLNRVYRDEPALHELDFSQAGFAWVDCEDDQHSVISFIRRGKQRDTVILTVCNFTPVPRPLYRTGVPAAGRWTELLNSDATEYGGSGQGNMGESRAVSIRYHDLDYSLLLTLPPLSVLYFKHDRAADSLVVGGTGTD
jgi:1,4-alpha-glucan branching enzyme